MILLRQDEVKLGRRLMVGQVPFHPIAPKAGATGTPEQGVLAVQNEWNWAVD